MSPDILPEVWVATNKPFAVDASGHKHTLARNNLAVIRAAERYMLVVVRHPHLTIDFLGIYQLVVEELLVLHNCF